MTADTKDTVRAAADDGTLALTVDVRVEHGSLEIGYRALEKAGLPVLVFDVPRRVAADGRLKVDRGIAWASLEEPETLVVKRGVPRLPRRKDVEFAQLPYARKLEPGRHLDGRVLLEVPVAETSPYYPAGARSVFRNASARRLRFELTYVVLESGLAARPVPDFPDAFELDRRQAPAGTGASRTIAVDVPLASPIAVRRRSDPFEPA